MNEFSSIKRAQIYIDEYILFFDTLKKKNVMLVHICPQSHVFAGWIVQIYLNNSYLFFRMRLRCNLKK